MMNALDNELLSLITPDKNQQMAVALPGGATKHHKGPVQIRNGHLFLIAPNSCLNMTAVAVFAPGHWVSVELVLDC